MHKMNREPPEFKLPKHRFSNARTPSTFWSRAILAQSVACLLLSEFPFCSSFSSFLISAHFSVRVCTHGQRLQLGITLWTGLHFSPTQYNVLLISCLQTWP